MTATDLLTLKQINGEWRISAQKTAPPAPPKRPVRKPLKGA